ncbi:MAG: hypothetical protein HYV68_01520 [Candidatus Taylorbacteria bacterium]|nr:hypothetical protein [Candidatus Taylorbacteria bacterium]
MSFELPEEQSKAEKESIKKPKGWTNEGENFKLTAQMQFKLAERYLLGHQSDVSHHELGDVVFRWADMDNHINASRFRELMEENPKLLDMYKTDPDGTLALIEERIYSNAPISAEKQYQLYSED